jgi:hypothetical protein
MPKPRLRVAPWIAAFSILSISLLIVPGIGAQGPLSRLAPVLAQILRINKDVSGDVDKLLSGMNAVGDAYLGRPVQPPGSTTDEFVELTKQRTKRINDLELPSFGAPMPSTTNVPSNSFDAIRGELRTRNRMLMAAVIELAEGRSLRDQLREGVQRVQQARKAAKTLGDLLQKIAPFDVTHAIGFTWLSLTTDVDSALSDQETAIRTKRDEWLAMLKLRGTALQAARLDLHNNLLVESVALQGQALVARAERDALSARKTTIDQEQSIVDALLADIKLLRAEKARLIAERDSLQRVRSSRQSSLASLQNEQQMLRNELAKPFDLCPNRNTYQACGHPELKKQWDQRVADLNRRLSGVQQSIGNYSREINDLGKQIATADGNIASQQSRIDQAVASHQTRDAALQKTRAKWQTDYDDFLAREHRSRVILYADENARDQQQIGSIESRIQEVLQ